MKEMIFRGVPVRVFPKGKLRYRYIDCPFYIVQMPDGSLFLDVINHGIYISFDGREVLGSILVEETKHEIPRNYDLEPVTLGALFTRSMIAITQEECDSLLEGLVAV